MASAFKGDRSLNAPSSKGASRRKLSNYQPFPFSPAAAGGTSGPLVLHWNHDLLGMHGISNNRVWNQTCAFAWSTLLLCPFLHHNTPFLHHSALFFLVFHSIYLATPPKSSCKFPFSDFFSDSALTKEFSHTPVLKPVCLPALPAWREGFNSWSTIVVVCLFT